MTRQIASREDIESAILMVRGEKVMLDSDLAELYGVETKVLNQAVTRNLDRFPDDFMFRLTQSEKSEVVTNCDHLARLKFSPVMPRAFTEHGILMLSSVLRSKRAVQVNIEIMRTFVRMRRMFAAHADLARKLAALEKKTTQHDKKLAIVFDAIRALMADPTPKRKRIGFVKSNDAR